MSHAEAEETSSPEAAILNEIKEAEKKADETLERAKQEKDSIIHQARSSALKLIALKEEEIRKTQEKKVLEFMDKAKLLNQEKLAEGKTLAKQIKIKSEKNIPKAVDFVIKKLEEMI